MNTDEYTTYKCERCGEHKSVDQVRNAYDEHPSPTEFTKWLCRRCLLGSMYHAACNKCGSTDRDFYASAGVLLCGPCIIGMETVQDVLNSNDGLGINKRDLGTGEPEEEESYAQEWWESLVEEAS